LQRGGVFEQEDAMASSGNRGGCYDSGSDHDGGLLQRPLLLNSGSWYRMGSRQSSLGAGASSTAVLRESHVSAFLCTLIIALGPIQFGFTGGYSSPTQDAIIRDLNLSISEVLPLPGIFIFSLTVNEPFASSCLKITLTAVLGVWLAVERGRHGWGDCQWTAGRVHWPQRGEKFAPFLPYITLTVGSVIR
jgi:hypothetical protein